MNLEAFLICTAASVCQAMAVWLSCHWIVPPVLSLLERPIRPMIVRAGELGVDEQRLRERLLFVEVSFMVVVLVASWQVLGLLLGATVIGISIHLRGWVLSWIVDRQEQLMRRQIMDFTNKLDGLQGAARTLPQSFESLAMDTPAPLGKYVANIVLEDKRGRPLAEALAAAAQKMKLEEFSLLTATLRCALRHQASLNKFISGVRETLANRQQADQQLHSRTSAARSQMFYMTLFPALFMLGMCVLMPKAVFQLFTETVGQLVFVAIAWFIYIGIIWGRGMLNIK